MQIVNHWLQPCDKKWVSTHYNLRPDPRDISLIIIHNISLPPGVFGTGCIQDFFCGNLAYHCHPYFETLRDIRIASHVLIDRAGKIEQFVPFDRRAWHAGESIFRGRENCNDFSIGIELEGTDDLSYEIEQYDALIVLIKVLQVVYPKTAQYPVVGHCDVAPHRKTDPGAAFDWQKLQQSGIKIEV